MKRLFGKSPQRPREAAAPQRRPRMAPQERRPAVSCPPTRTDGIFRQAMETGRTRLLITGAVMSLAFAVVGLRLVEVSALRLPEEPKVVRAARDANLKMDRANVVDRNGVILATSLRTVSLSADPKKIIDVQEAATKLAVVLPNLNAADLARKLSSKRRFVWLQRQLTPLQHWEVNRLGIPGLEFHHTESRVYPQGKLQGHVMGFTDIDNNGLSGVEKEFNEALRSTGQPLQLSIDVRLQHLLREEVGNAMREFSAIGGAGIIMDSRSGEIMAMTSLPDFDPNHAGDADANTRFNRATLGVYELGSTFKIFNTAAALETGIATMRSNYDARKPIRIARFAIRDYHAKNRVLSVPEIFVYSSNIGSAKMAQDMGAPAQKAFLGSLGFLKPLPVELPEVGSPIYPNVWRPINTMTISYGHGVSVSPLHLASGVAAMVNGGEYFEPTLVKPLGERKGSRVISPRTSAQVRKLMRLNNVEGSGKASNAEGYIVGGKTGTAEKVGARGGYKRKSLISSYVAAFPMNDPRYVIYVLLDEPQGTKKTHGYATGGWVAAPVIRQVVQRMAPIVGIQPLDAQSPEISQQLAIELPQEGRTLASF